MGAISDKWVYPVFWTIFNAKMSIFYYLVTLLLFLGAPKMGLANPVGGGLRILKKVVAYLTLNKVVLKEALEGYY